MKSTNSEQPGHIAAAQAANRLYETIKPSSHDEAMKPS
jgi:hypothetical protein